jgi:hypothetical protein
MIYQGGCHCSAIRFEVEAPEKITCANCNCSICSRSGFLHLIVPKSKFRLLKGEGNMTTYAWGSEIAQHTFCRTCGIKPFYVPRSNPDGYDVNVRCLDTRPSEIEIESFDGQNWEMHAHELAHMSKDS